MSLADPEERSQPCPRGHGPEHREFKGNGRWVCYACRSQFANRTRNLRRSIRKESKNAGRHQNH